jgi:hypothetical protein
MITCFPDPYPDELLFSVCARFDSMMMYPHKWTSVQQMFGNRDASAAVDLPNRIDCLINSLLYLHRYTADGLIDDHTLFPLYASFIPLDRAHAIRSEMRGAGKNHVHERLGITAGRLKQPSNLKFCPECVLDDRKHFGETYWHCAHQVTGVEVCPDHSVFLEISGALWHNSKSRGGIVTAEQAVQDVIARPLDLTETTHNILLKLARSVAWLLAWRGHALDSKVLRDRYYNIMLQRSLAYFNGRIRTNKFLRKFIEFYSPELLEKLQCSVRSQSPRWPLYLIHSNKIGIVQHPLRHLLLMTFLDCTPEEVFTTFEEYKPFGDGPWPCLNKASDHYLQSHVVQCRVTHSIKKNSGKPMSTFICDCGFTYTRTGPDRTDEDRFEASSVQFYGHVWEESLRNLWKDISLTIREIAQRLGVGELTVKRHAIQLGLTFPRNTPGSMRASGEILERYRRTHKTFSNLLEKRRQEWLKILALKPGAGRSELRQSKYHLWLWLKRNDSEWLEFHLPESRQVAPQPKSINWMKEDVQLAAKVEAAALRIKNIVGRPVRVSLAILIRETGHRTWLEGSLNKFPLATKALDEHLESFEDFLLRRIEWAKEYCLKKGTMPTLYQLEVLAGTRKSKSKTQKVQDAIDVALKNLTR